MAAALPILLGAALGAGTLGVGAARGKEGLFGKPGEIRALPTTTTEQGQALDQLLGGAQQQLPDAFGFLSNILGQSPEAMQQFQAPALRQFREQIVPDIAQRFGEVGGLQSSGFQQALGQGAERLTENLAAQRAGLGFQGLGQLQNLLKMGLEPRFQYQTIPESPGFVQNAIQSLFGMLGGAR
jgi:hypothetical protein